MPLFPTVAATLTVASEGGGFNPFHPAGIGSMLWTWIIFLVALPFIWRIVMGPVTRALEERDDKAVRAIEAAEKASAEAEEARAEVEVRLGEARNEATKMMAAARERAEAREREIVEQAKSEAASMVETARQTIRAEQDKAIAAIRSEVVDLSLNAAEKVIARSVDNEDNRRLVGELVTSSREATA